VQALPGIRHVMREVVEDRRPNQEPIPPPIDERSISGNFVVRVPAEPHRKLVLEAAEAARRLHRHISYQLALAGGS